MAESTNNKFTCACGEGFRSACQNHPFFKSHDGKDYCVLHYPDIDKLDEFRTAISHRLDRKDFNFRGVWFPEAADFRNTIFNTVADFSGAYFNAAADFSHTSFCTAADFSSTNFNALARFMHATFSGQAGFISASFSAIAYFDSANFGADAFFMATSFCASALFRDANFSAPTYFIEASFKADANFSSVSFDANVFFVSVSFKDYVYFSGKKKGKSLGEKPYLDLQFARIEKPERVSFHTLILRPHWFINVDSRKFEFIDVDWDYRLKDELQSAIEIKVGAPHRLLAIAFRQLADNAEANHRYHEASRFRYNAFEARRIERFHGFVPWRLDWWYWLASGYGESVGRAFLVFVALLALFTLGYKCGEFVPSAPTAAPPATVVANTAPPTAPDLPPKRLGWREAALYSFNVSILQKPEPKPKGLWTSFLVSLETVLGPAQAALLALAVRRRFMR